MKRRSQNGNALIEAALSLAVLGPIFLATFQFGLAFVCYNNLANAVRAGARYAAVRTYDSPTATPSAAFIRDVRNMTVYGDPHGGGRPVVAGLTPGHVEVAVITDRTVPQQIRVSIRQFPMNVLVKTFQISKPEAVFPYLGHYAPEN